MRWYSSAFYLSLILHGLLLLALAIYWYKKTGVTDVATTAYVPTYVAERHPLAMTGKPSMPSSHTTSASTAKPVATSMKPLGRARLTAAKQPSSPISAATKQVPSLLSEVVNQQDIQNELLNILHTAIAKNQIYPESASMLNQSGTVTVQFVLQPNGVIIHPMIYQSSGVKSLDQSAMQAVQSLPILKQIQGYLQHDEVFTVDIIFQG